MKKRLFDLCFTVPAILVTAPFLFLVGCAVKLQDGGPVFYRQERVGLMGRPFRIWKFRSMRVDADKAGLSVTKLGDPRVTPLGAWLRRTKADELPQLFNILAGEMSLVGPRPEVARYVSLYTAEQSKVLNLRPGITDIASIEFRDEEAMLGSVPDVEEFYVSYCMPLKIALNLKYAANASIWSDARVLLLTVRALFVSQRRIKFD